MESKTFENTKDDLMGALGKLATLRDEVKLHLHLASLDAKQEWDEKLAPRLTELEASAKNVGDASRATASELVEKVEAFLVRIRPGHKN